jgi:hypothetical protein
MLGEAMRRKSTLALIITLSVVLICLSGCGNSEVAKEPPDGAAPAIDRWTDDLETRTYTASFGDVTVTLDIPAEGDEADAIRSSMSQAPPYLVGNLTVSNGSKDVARFYDFIPVLVYADGTRDEGFSITAFETDAIAPGESLSALFQFSHSTLEGLEELLISRRGEGERGAQPTGKTTPGYRFYPSEYDTGCDHTRS